MYGSLVQSPVLKKKVGTVWPCTSKIWYWNLIHWVYTFFFLQCISFRMDRCNNHYEIDARTMEQTNSCHVWRVTSCSLFFWRSECDETLCFVACQKCCGSHHYFFFCGTGIWTQGFALAKQTPYHFSHNSSSFCSCYFGDGRGLSNCLSWLASNFNPTDLSFSGS
jgi:hypothetical protein